MKIEQLMTNNPRLCQKGGTLNDAAKILWEADCGMVPIVERVDEKDRLIGVLTDRDICMAAYTTGQPLSEVAVENVMSTEPRTCSPDAPVEAAERTMRQSQIRRLPVVDGAGAILGVLSLADIACEAERKQGGKSPDVTESEVGATLGAISEPRAIAAV